MDRIATINDWASFSNYLLDPATNRVARVLARELFPASLPRLDPLELLDQARNDPKSRILAQRPGPAVDLAADAADAVRRCAVAEAAAMPFLHLTLFDLTDLCAPGRVLHGFAAAVLAPLARWVGRSAALDERGRLSVPRRPPAADAPAPACPFWRAAGTGWSGEVWPILFINGSRAATNYHIDPIPTAPWHLFGDKRFHGLRDPDRWCSPALREVITRGDGLALKPGGIRDDDCLAHDNERGDLVWIPALTPHWVETGSFAATITLAFERFEVHPAEPSAIAG